ncbi:MAG TPA: hypothetical protein VFF04_02315 [Candidatus Babeliales bacterium]|nr:hypothetical protein [Candidatus Babeliales bacterium]
MNTSKAYQFWPKWLLVCIILSALSLVTSVAVGAGIGKLTRRDTLRNAVKVAQIATSVGAAIVVGKKVFDVYNNVPRWTRYKSYNHQLDQQYKEHVAELNPSVRTRALQLGLDVLEAQYRSKLTPEEREARDKQQREQAEAQRNEKNAQIAKATMRKRLAKDNPELFDREEFWQDASMGLLGGAAGGGATYLLWELCTGFFGIS